MLRWWVAMLIGAVTLCIGYWAGKTRVRGLLKMAEELADRTSLLLEKTHELLEEIKDEQQE